MFDVSKTIQHPSFRYHYGVIFALDDDGNDIGLTVALDTARVFARELADFAASHQHRYGT